MYDLEGDIGGLAKGKEGHNQTTLSDTHGFVFILSQIKKRIFSCGYFHALVLVDTATGYRWIYGMKTKDDTLKVVRRWYNNIADLRAKHKFVVLMRDNANEYKSEEIMQFLD